MQETLVPVKIRKHLIPFLYKEFSGVDASYLGKTVKACQINTTSSLGFMVSTTLERAAVPVKAEKYFIYISMSEEERQAEMFQSVSGKSNWLQVPEKVCDKINDILEDHFRIAFVYFVDGMLKANKFHATATVDVGDAIGEFMVMYELDEAGFELESMRRLYHREKTKDAKFSRMQVKPSNRVNNYRD